MISSLIIKIFSKVIVGPEYNYWLDNNYINSSLGIYLSKLWLYINEFPNLVFSKIFILWLAV